MLYTKGIALLRTLEGHTSPVNSVAVVGEDHTIVSGSDDNTVRVWRLSDGELLRTLEGHTDSVISVAVVGDHTIVSGSMDNTVRVWGQPTADEGTAGGSSSTDPEGVAGLSSLLTGCNLQDKLAEAAKWCEEQGVDSVAMLQELGPEWADKLIASLDGLKPARAALLKKRIVEWSEIVKID